MPSNRLADETSAYLLQHRDNPVDWYPWGDEALARAQREDRPLLVSIGYSACHWCHVMERESFEDVEIAALMNEHFVCIKVDREERPDVDQIYMDTAIKIHGHGGWPLNVFCKPDGSPFFAGTYYPPTPRSGMPSFRQVLESLAETWRVRRDEVDEAAGQILQALAERPERGGESAPDLGSVVAGALSLMSVADEQHGGFGVGQGAKFPTPTNLELLFASLDFVPDESEAQRIAEHCATTCREMARGGLFDHVGGGFHRYCVDQAWTIPHFEKMLYDQGLLLQLYAEAWRRFQGPADLVWPIRETIDYLRREMMPPDGGFYASQDADAEGEEGRFHVWTRAEIDDALGDRAASFAQAYGVTPAGNFEGGRTHLVDVHRGERKLYAEERALLRDVRSRRPAPETDRKRVAAWQGYVISGMARAGGLLDDADILADAAAGMDFVANRMIDDQGRLYRVFDRDRRAVPAFLDDHAALLGACLDLYKHGAGQRFLPIAIHLAEQIMDRFYDARRGDLFFTANDAPALPHRPRSDHDGATPSASGLATLQLLRLWELADWREAGEVVDRVIAAHAAELEEAPHAHPTLLRALALRFRRMSAAVIVGPDDDSRTRALAVQARRILLPDDAVIILPPGRESIPGVAASWLRGRTLHEGRPAAYVCRGMSCSLPVTDPAEIAPLEGMEIDDAQQAH